jgi:hypothetical protein
VPALKHRLWIKMTYTDQSIPYKYHKINLYLFIIISQNLCVCVRCVVYNAALLVFSLATFLWTAPHTKRRKETTIYFRWKRSREPKRWTDSSPPRRVKMRRMSSLSLSFVLAQ